MHNLGLKNALSLWADLEDAYNGRSKFGGTIAEIYAHRFGEQTGAGKMVKAYEEEESKSSALALYNFLTTFAERRDCTIKINGRKLGPWLKKESFSYRAHVEVISNQG